MSLWKKLKNSEGREKLEIDPKQLHLRLKSLLKQGNIEVMQLGLESLLEEIEDYKQHC